MNTFALAALAGVASATIMTNVDYSYMQFVSTFNKFYDTVEEFNMRKELYIASEAAIQAQNSKTSGYTAGHNQLSDWTAEEMNSMLGLTEEDADLETEVFSGVPNSTGIDWRNTKDVVSPVKD